jgi:hypothetical protein
MALTSVIATPAPAGYSGEARPAAYHLVMAMSHDQLRGRDQRPGTGRLRARRKLAGRDRLAGRELRAGRERRAGSVLAIALPVAVVAGLAAGCGSSGTGTAAAGAAASQSGTASGAASSASSPTASAPASTASAGTASAGAASASPSPSLTVLPVPVPAADLHQTRAFPSASTPVFRAEMTDLWAAVVTGRPSLGMPAFFPLIAYRQVKAIADPAADWQDRLVGEFRLDVAAAHRLLGAGARQARLVSVLVPEAQASWITPGVCYNGVGYWHVAGPRLVYRLDGQLRSIGIASLISWRGQWYVVHFGAVIRTGPGGMVDQPAVGTGTPGPPGGC